MDAELKGLLEKQGTAFETFKTEVNKSLTEGKSETAEVKSSLAKLNDELDKVGKEIDDWNKKMASIRSASEVEHALKRAGDVKSMNHHLSSVYAASGKNTAPPVVDGPAYEAYQKAFNSWMRSGKDHMDADGLKAMHTGNDPSGGYLVTPDTSGVVVTRMRETSDMRAIASIQTIGTDALEGRTDLDEADAGWVGEQQARPATGTPELGKWRIPVHEMYAMPEATVKLLEDSSIDVAAWLAAKVSDKFSRLENTAFVNGNTINKPRGFLSYTTAATADGSRDWGVLEHVVTGTSGGFGAAPNGTEKFVDLIHKLKAVFRRNATFVFNRTTLAAIRKLKDADGNFMWLPSMTEDTPNRLMGYGYREFEDMPDIAANTLSVAFGDFKAGYQIVDRLGIRVIRDDLTNKPFVRFYTVRRVGGDVINFEAIKFLKFGT